MKLYTFIFLVISNLWCCFECLYTLVLIIALCGQQTKNPLLQDASLAPPFTFIRNQNIISSLYILSFPLYFSLPFQILDYIINFFLLCNKNLYFKLYNQKYKKIYFRLHNLKYKINFLFLNIVI